MPDDTLAPFSLRKRVAWRLIPPLLFFLVLNAFWSYRSAMEAANRAYDLSLNASLKGIAEHIHASGGNISVNIPYSALDIFEGNVQEHVYYAIIGPGGKRLTGYDDLQVPDLPELEDEPMMVDARYREQSIRLGVLAKRLYDPELPGGDVITILFAETTEARGRLASDLFIESQRPQLLLIVAGLIMISIILQSAFRPLVELRNAIRQRSEEDLTPVSSINVPNELHPLVDAVNYHMGRLDRLLQSRRRFLADAAHQLRTPLTVLGAQAEYGQRQCDPDEMRRTFASQIVSIRSTRRMTDQMLTLVRAEPVNGLIQTRSRLDFAELVRDVAGDLATLAIAKNVDLSFEGAAGPVFVDGDATLLREMVSNLLDNALRYAPVDGHVALDVGYAGSEIRLWVTDDGPGIPESERERVFHRFYRILGQADAEGSGLGLSIVREICWAHGGKIRLDDNPAGRGLLVEVVLPPGR